MNYRKVLIIDDDVSICELLRDVTESSGYETRITTAESDFKIVFNNFKPDILIMDLNLGKTDGIGLLKYLSYLKATCKIILISGYEERVLSIANQLGVSHGLDMYAFLQKPVSIATLKNILETLQLSAETFKTDDVIIAIDKDEMLLHFQPKISIKNNQIIGIESLVRWDRKDKSLIMPDDFIPFVEANNLTKMVTMAIIEIAFKAILEIQKQSSGIEISINLSGKDLDDLELPDKIQDLACKYNINPEKICFEVTETAIMEQAEVIMEVLTRLRLKGFQLSIDDFGTGYSSLVKLRKMPITELKIDKSFILNLTTNKDDRIITKTLIDLGHNLGLKVTAEGVESKEILEQLTDYNCDIAQGYYFSKPLAMNDVKQWMSTFKN